MTVRFPARSPRPDQLRDQSAVDALREQEALIKEARRRARRRRQRSAALALLGLLLAVAVGPADVGGSQVRDASSTAAQVALNGPAARNGKIAFADELGQLQAVNPDGSAPRVIEQCPRSPHGCALAEPAWSPDGTQIAFVSGSVGLTPVPSGHRVSHHDHPTLYVFAKDAARGRTRRLAACGRCGEQYGARLSWSPDSSQIAFSRDAGPAGATQSLWVVKTAGGEPRRLTDCRPELCADISGDWAPSGQLIVFSRIADGGSSLYTVRPDGSQLTRITDSAFAADPKWSPDGRELAFDGENEIFVTDADGSNQKLLFAGTVGNGPGIPSWSPDATKLAFFNTPREAHGFSAEVWITNTDGSSKRPIYHSICCVNSWAAPVWSPDGTQLAFAASSALGVFVINPDGSGLHRISTASASALSWQPLP